MIKMSQSAREKLDSYCRKVTWISWPTEKCDRIFVDKIDYQLKILWLSTFIDKLNLSIDNYRQISSTIDLSTTFTMIDFDRHVKSWLNLPPIYLRLSTLFSLLLGHSKIATFPLCDETVHHRFPLLIFPDLFDALSQCCTLMAADFLLYAMTAICRTIVEQILLA